VEIRIIRNFRPLFSWFEKNYPHRILIISNTHLLPVFQQGEARKLVITIVRHRNAKADSRLKFLIIEAFESLLREIHLYITPALKQGMSEKGN